MKPTRYFVQYENKAKLLALLRQHETPEEIYPSRYWERADAASLQEAERLAARLDGVIYERTNLQDVTPVGDPPGLLWEWDEELVAGQGGR